MGMQAVDLAIQNGVDLDGTPIPQKMLDLYNRIMDEENKRQRSGVKKSMRNRCVKTGSKHSKRIDQKIAKLLKKAISYLISFKSQVPLTIAVNIMQ